MRSILLIILTALLGNNALAQAFRHPVLDTLVSHLSGPDQDSPLHFIDQALRSLAPNDDPRVYYFLRRYRCEQLYYQGLWDESLVEAERAKRIAEELNDSLLLASSLNQVAVLLEESQDNIGAIALLLEALERYPKNDSSHYAITRPYRIHGNLGLCYANLGQLERARTHQELSFQLAESTGVVRGQILALLELGRLDMSKGDHGPALEKLQRAQRSAAASNIPDIDVEARTTMAVVHCGMGHVLEGLKTFQEACLYVGTQPGVAPRTVIELHATMARTLADMGLHHEALDAARTWHALDSVQRIKAAATAQRTLLTLHATDAALAAERYRAEAAAREAKIGSRTRKITLIGGAAVFTLLLVALLLHLARVRQKDRLARLTLLRAEQERMITDLHVREQLGRDLHDDLGAGLSALKLHCELATDLAADEVNRKRNAALSNTAGELIEGMRHILWSVDHPDATADEIHHYLASKAHAYCAQRDHALRLTGDAHGPSTLVPAALRQLPWLMVKDALKCLLENPFDDPVELEVRWNEQLEITVRCPVAEDKELRTQLASTMAEHQVDVSRLGGSIRTRTEGAVSVTIRLPKTFPPEQTGLDRRTFAGPLIALLLFASTAVAQKERLFEHPVLDSLLSPAANSAPLPVQLRALNAAMEHLSGEEDPRLECHLLLSRANVMYHRGLYDMGIADVNRSLVLAQQVNDSLLIATTYNMIGLLNENLGNDAVTLPWFEKAQAWMPVHGASNYPVVKDYHLDGNMAQCHLNLGRTTTAEDFFRRSWMRATEAKDTRAMALALLGLGQVKILHADHAEAARLLETALTCANIGPDLDVVYDILPVQAELLIREGKTHKGLDLLDSSIALLEEDTLISSSCRRDVYEQESRLRESAGRLDEAVVAWRKWWRADSAIHVEDDRAALATVRIMFDNDRELLEQRALRDQEQAQRELTRHQHTVLLIASASIALLVLGIVLLYTSRQRNKRKTLALRLERSQASKRLAELHTRHSASEEMHRQLGKGLAALELRTTLALASVEDPIEHTRLRTINQHSKELIGSLRRITWAMETEQSSLAGTIDNTLYYSVNYAAQHGLSLHANVQPEWPDMELDNDQRRAIFLVVKEALHNTVKHARADRVDLDIWYDRGVHVRLSDNGPGFQSPSPRAGNGLRNMRARIENLGGTFIMDSKAGVTIAFHIPLVAAQNESSTLDTLSR